MERSTSRRDVLRAGAAWAALPLAMPLAQAAVASGAVAGGGAAPAHAGPAIDPLALVPPELRGPLEEMQKAYGDFEIGPQNLQKMRAMRWPSHEEETPHWEKRTIPGPRGAPDVDVYVVNAAAEGAGRPAILHTHGGGYVLGDARSQVPMLQATARELDCTIVTVDYRLAPEAPFPASLEDNYAGLLWLHAHARELGVDPARIALMGESAGGGHAALLAIAARDRGEVTPCAQVLVYPMLDDRTASTRAVPAHIGTFSWNRRSNVYGWSAFLGRPAGSARVPVGAVPARVADLSRLPPAWIGVGALDLFVQEDVDYARRLLEAGVSVELQVVPGAYHGFDGMAPQAPLSQRFRASWIGALRRAFA